MDITWYGHSCFTLKGKKATLVTDPYSDRGFTLEKLKGDIVLTGEMEHKELASVAGDPVKVDVPGEFEIKEVAIQGIQMPGHTTIYVMQMDEFRICHLGSLASSLAPDIIEKIGDVDILLIPCGGKNVVDAKKAHEIIEEIEPRIVIPMDFLADGDTTQYDGVENLLKISGVNPPRVDTFSIANKSQLPQEKTEYVVLNVK